MFHQRPVCSCVYKWVCVCVCVCACVCECVCVCTDNVQKPRHEKIEQSQQERRNNCSTENWATAPHLVVPFWQIMPQTKAQHFFSALWPLPPARYHRSLLPYAILANSNDFLSRKSQKTSFLAHFGPFLPKFGPQHFFFENRASSLFSTPVTLTSCKKSKKTNDGKYENFCDGQTTDGHDRF